MRRADAIVLLKKANSFCDLGEIQMYVDSFFDYIEAQKNIQKNGNIVMHPRTGAPIQNPYIEIKLGAMRALRQSKIEDSSPLWLTVDFDVDETAKP